MHSDEGVVEAGGLAARGALGGNGGSGSVQAPMGHLARQMHDIFSGRIDGFQWSILMLFGN